MEIQTPAFLTYGYGITERKKADLDALVLQIIDAQAEVQQQSAIVNALTVKSQTFAMFLAEADANRTISLNNKSIIDGIVQDALDLRDNSEVAFVKIVATKDSVHEVAKRTKNVINKLIFTVEVINKLSVAIIQKKSLNPLISDDLIDKVAKIGTDANNAVALTLLALQSIFATQATGLETEAAITLEYMQSKSLYDLILLDEKVTVDKKVEYTPSIRNLLYKAYDDAKAMYTETDRANNETTRQLNAATVNLNKATIKLASLQSGLAAANAAAFA